MSMFKKQLGTQLKYYKKVEVEEMGGSVWRAMLAAH
jgi:hypothetical protein